MQVPRGVAAPDRDGVPDQSPDQDDHDREAPSSAGDPPADCPAPGDPPATLEKDLLLDSTQVLTNSEFIRSHSIFFF